MKQKQLFFAGMCLLMFSFVVADSLYAQGRRGGGRGMMDSRYFLLMNESVQKELGMVDDQVRELEQLQSEAMQMMRDMFSEAGDRPRDEQSRDEFRKKIEEKMKPIQEKLDNVLLPHQQDRLKQLGYQRSGGGRRGGGNSPGSALQNEDLLDELGVTDEQREELEEAREKAQEKLREQYQKLVKKAEEDILDILDSDQRKKYRELVGEPFQFEDGRGGGRRDRGGRDRGGRDRGGRGDRGR